MGRYLSIWIPQLVPDKVIKIRPELKQIPFVIAAAQGGRTVVQAANKTAVDQGILPGMVVADARAIQPDLKIFQDKPGRAGNLLHELAEWCLRFTPVAAADLPHGLMLEITGCAHLWGGEEIYAQTIIAKINNLGYTVSIAIADTIGAAWALARYGKGNLIIHPGAQHEALLSLPPAALRLDTAILDRMQKLGFYQLRGFINMPRSVLRRRFGQELLLRIDQALGQAFEVLEPIQPVSIFQERLPCLDPIRTATGISIALNKLLEQLCQHLLEEGKGLRSAVFEGYRIDGVVEKIEIGTNRAVRNITHLFKLFEQKIATITPALGIELFILKAPAVEDLSVQQESLWQALGGEEGSGLALLLDRIAGRVGKDAIQRYLPAAHYWPERSFRPAVSLYEKADIQWRTDRPRPVCLLAVPEKIEVTVPIPDYPPLLFIYKGQTHKIKKADGPERIEREWWLEQGLVRDYYCVEDEAGARYWLFRSGHYQDDHKPEWFIHGFFA